MFNNDFLNKVKELLLSQKKEILSKSHQDTNVDTDGDETDEIQANMLIEMNNQLGSRNVEKIMKINNALKKIEDKTYGLCETCEEPILEKRLLINPYCVSCISCAEAKEIEDRQRRRV